MAPPTEDPGRANLRGTMDDTTKPAADHTVDPGVLPTPTSVEYETDAPIGKVETFDTGVILVIR